MRMPRIKIAYHADNKVLETKYYIYSVSNSVTPVPGRCITEEEIEKLIAQGWDVTIRNVA